MLVTCITMLTDTPLCSDAQSPSRSKWRLYDRPFGEDVSHAGGCLTSFRYASYVWRAAHFPVSLAEQGRHVTWAQPIRHGNASAGISDPPQAVCRGCSSGNSSSAHTVGCGPAELCSLCPAKWEGAEEPRVESSVLWIRNYSLCIASMPPSHRETFPKMLSWDVITLSASAS